MNRCRNVSVVLAATITSAAVLLLQPERPSLAKAETNRRQARASDSTAITDTPNILTDLDDPNESCTQPSVMKRSPMQYQIQMSGSCPLGAGCC